MNLKKSHNSPSISNSNNSLILTLVLTYIVNDLAPHRVFLFSLSMNYIVLFTHFDKLLANPRNFRHMNRDNNHLSYYADVIGFFAGIKCFLLFKSFLMFTLFSNPYSALCLFPRKSIITLIYPCQSKYSLATEFFSSCLIWVCLDLYIVL